MSDIAADDLSSLLDPLWAVVAYDHRGASRRLLWSATQRAWRPSLAFGPGFASEPNADDDSRPYENELEAMSALVERLLRDRICQHCGLSGLEDHFIAPDIYDDPRLYCVQLPDPSVVESFGGGGDRKHWGSRGGCSSVKARFLTDSDGYEYVEYGDGLVAAHVRDRAWCSRCSGAAYNLKRAAEAKGVSVIQYIRDRESELLRARASNRARNRHR